jgi:hypothetical protein
MEVKSIQAIVDHVSNPANVNVQTFYVTNALLDEIAAHPLFQSDEEKVEFEVIMPKRPAVFFPAQPRVHFVITD